MGKKIMSVLSVLLVIGAIVMKCYGPDLVKEAIKSEYKEGKGESEEDAIQLPATVKIDGEKPFILYDDGTARQLDSDTPLNFQVMEGSIYGEDYSFIYVYKMEDTSKPKYILTEDDSAYVFGIMDLNYFMEVGTGYGTDEIDGDISADLLYTAIKNYKKRSPNSWKKCVYEEGEGF